MSRFTIDWTQANCVRILTRYILGEISSYSLIGCAVFTFILFMRDLEHILEMVVRNSSSVSAVLATFAYTLPNTFMVTIPMAVLVGVLLGLSRLAADSEIIAMRASGFGIWYFVRVAAIVAVLGTAVGLVNSMYLSPAANHAILDLQHELETTQASFEIQPRVFYEDFKNTVVYVQDVRSGAGASNWRQLFIADVTDPTTPGITTAESATVAEDSDQGLLIRLRNGSEHAMQASAPDQYNISHFTTTDRPLAFSPQSDVHLGRRDTPIFAMTNGQLLTAARTADKAAGRHYRIEFQRRLAYPIACLVLMLVGVPLGAASRRGGKSMAFVYALLLVLAYYLLSDLGLAWARQGKLSPALGVWLANIVFAAVGIFLLNQMATGGVILNRMAALFQRRPVAGPPATLADGSPAPAGAADAHELTINTWTRFLARWRPHSVRRRVRSHLPHHFPHFKRRTFPLILDWYLLREFSTMFLMVQSSIVLILLVFTFFDLMGDILRNHAPLSMVGAYLLNLTPSMVYQSTPLSVLIATLVTFGGLNRTSELTAMKATGISLYRLVIPVVAIGAILGAALFAFDQSYLPQANRRQEALRNTIKGRPAQTTLHPDQKWIFGAQQPGQPERIFYYQFFDQDANAFANMTVFEFDPASFAVTRRIFASRVVWNADEHAWNFENGWVRNWQGQAFTGFRPFLLADFPEISEGPGYFKKENLQSQEMNYGQLQHYINDLRQSGFDTMRLRVQLYHKLAYPLVSIIMTILAVPFAVSMGRRGSLTGLATAIGIAISYWVIAGLFDAMGSVNYLPPTLAAWSPDILFGLAGSYMLLRTPT